MRLIVIATLGLVGLVGCAGPTIVVMKNPTTGEIKQCGQPMGLTPIIDSYAAKSCAEGYQAAGWQRMN